jgi:hypothetical protein
MIPSSVHASPRSMVSGLPAVMNSWLQSPPLPKVYAVDVLDRQLPQAEVCKVHCRAQMIITCDRKGIRRDLNA